MLGGSEFTSSWNSLKGRKRRTSRHVIWMTTVLVQWITRNNVIFRGGYANVIDVVASIKALS